jgi:hypothetical protein
MQEPPEHFHAREIKMQFEKRLREVIGFAGAGKAERLHEEFAVVESVRRRHYAAEKHTDDVAPVRTDEEEGGFETGDAPPGDADRYGNCGVRAEDGGAATEKKKKHRPGKVTALARRVKRLLSTGLRDCRGK